MAKRLDVLKFVYDSVIFGKEVRGPVLDQGRKMCAPWIEKIERALEERWAEVVELTAEERRLAQRIVKASRLAEGEGESLALARLRHLLVIMDDKEARALAETMRLQFVGTPGVLLEAFLRGNLTFRQLEEALEDLSDTIWLSPSVAAAVLKKAGEAGQ